MPWFATMHAEFQVFLVRGVLVNDDAAEMDGACCAVEIAWSSRA